MSAKEYYAENLDTEVYIASYGQPVIGGYDADQWRSYAEECGEDDEQWAAYAIARWLDSYTDY